MQHHLRSCNAGQQCCSSCMQHEVLLPIASSALILLTMQATSISPWVVTMDALEPFRSEQAALLAAALPHNRGTLSVTACMLTADLLGSVRLTFHICINLSLSLHLGATPFLLLRSRPQHLYTHRWLSHMQLCSQCSHVL